MTLFCLSFFLFFYLFLFFGFSFLVKDLFRFAVTNQQDQGQNQKDQGETRRSKSKTESPFPLITWKVVFGSSSLEILVIWVSWGLIISKHCTVLKVHMIGTQYGNTGCGVFKRGYKIRKVFA